MSIIGIRAYFSCDQCGQKLTVDLDPAEEGTLIEIAEAVLNDGQCHEDFAGAIFSGVRLGTHLCPPCCHQYDQANEAAFLAEDARRP